jgi:hypothetical protein
MGGEERCIRGFGGENVKERDRLEGPGVGGRIILGWIFRKWDWAGLIWLKIWTDDGIL